MKPSSVLPWVWSKEEKLVRKVNIILKGLNVGQAFNSLFLRMASLVEGRKNDYQGPSVSDELHIKVVREDGVGWVNFLSGKVLGKRLE